MLQQMEHGDAHLEVADVRVELGLVVLQLGRLLQGCLQGRRAAPDASYGVLDACGILRMPNTSVRQSCALLLRLLCDLRGLSSVQELGVSKAAQSCGLIDRQLTSCARAVCSLSVSALSANSPFTRSSTA